MPYNPSYKHRDVRIFLISAPTRKTDSFRIQTARVALVQCVQADILFSRYPDRNDSSDFVGHSVTKTDDRTARSDADTHRQRRV